jgi:hypothetical protein
MTPHHVEIRHGGQVVAAADVTMPAAGTARTSLRAAAGHVAPGWRTELVDAVMDLPEVQASHRLEATVPLGDCEFLERLREWTTGMVTRPAGSTLLLDATIPAGATARPSTRRA